MKKNRLSITLMTALLSVTALAGCNNDVKFSKEGVLVSYNKKGENPTQITADQIFVELNHDSSKYEQIYQAIRSIVIRNYFTYDDEVTLEGQTATKHLGKDELAELQDKAETKVNGFIYEAETASNQNKTTFKKEFDKICQNEGVEDKDELYEKYLNQYKEDRFNENMKKYHMSEIKNGSSEEALKDMWTGYYEDMVPYHISHILVKLDDANGTNYADGKISKEDCEQLYNVVSRLIKGTEKFQTLAGDNKINEDDGSAEEHGALGIMNFKTGFINEFKLGIYAYEQMFGKNTEGAISKIKIPQKDGKNTIEEDYMKAVKESYGLKGDNKVPTVDVSVFDDLVSVKESTKSPATSEEDKKAGLDFDKVVMEGGENVYPRNIIYNELLNRHTFAFIEAPVPTIENAKDVDEGVAGLYQFGENLGNKILLGVKVAGEMRPVIMARGGSDAYQGIHFIVIDRDPFTNEVNGVTQDEYYTTLKPTDAGFPRNADGTRKTTYINYASQELTEKEYDDKANALATTLQDYNADKLDKYFVKKYMKAEGVELKDRELAYQLDKWMENANKKAEKDETESYENTWNDYVNALGKQNKERKNLVSKACRIGFSKDIDVTVKLGDKMELFAESGFNDNVVAAKKDIQEKNLTLIKVSSVKNPVATDVEKAKKALDDAKQTLSDLEASTEGQTFIGYCILQGMTSVEVDEMLKNRFFGTSPLATMEFEVKALYNEKGALCNDGTTHTK